MVSDAPSTSHERRIFIQNLAELSTLPLVLTKILEVSNNPDSSAKDLGKAIAQDQSTSSMVLRVVNSAFYGRMRRVSSISQAIVILGFQTVKALAMSVSVFKKSPGATTGLDRNQFWIHALGSATISQLLYQQCGDKTGLSPDEAYLCGLLHDVGKVVFDNYFTDEYEAVIAHAQKEKQWIGTSEQEILEMCHSEAGYYLSQKWKFPTSVVAGIRYHHSSSISDSSHATAIALTHIADHLCREISLGCGGDMQKVALNSGMLAIAQVSSADLEKVVTEVESMQDEIKSMTLDA
jgi:HD-like signal output (HDOD) protein